MERYAAYACVATANASSSEEKAGPDATGALGRGDAGGGGAPHPMRVNAGRRQARTEVVTRRENAGAARETQKPVMAPR